MRNHKPLQTVVRRGQPVAAAAGESVRLSVIIPALNEATGISAALACLQPLRSRGHEVIVVDGGSNDATMRLSAPLVDKVVSAKRSRSIQLNTGALAARGDIFWFLHADSQVPELADQYIISSLATGEHQWGRFDVTLDGNSRLLKCIEWSMNLRSRVTGIATGDQGIFVSRAAFRQIGGFEKIPLMEDIAASRVLKRLSRPASLQVRLVTSARRWHDHGVVRTMLTMWGLRLGYCLGIPAQRLAEYYTVHTP